MSANTLGGGRDTVCLFGNIGTGHLSGMLALAERLTRSGWTVLFYAHAKARERVAATGAQWRNYGSDDWDLFSSARRATRERLGLTPDPLLDMSIVASALPAALDMLPYLLAEIERHRPRFTVHDAAATWGALAARLSGCPAVCSMSAFPLHAEEAAGTYPPGEIQEAAARDLFERYGVHYDPKTAYTNYTDCNLVFTTAHWASHRRADVHRYCGPAPVVRPADAMEHPAVVAASAARAAGKKVAYASFGTVISGTLNAYYEPAMHHIFTEVIGALRGRDDVQLILSSGRGGVGTPAEHSAMPGTGEALPDFVRWFEYTPQPEVLEHTDAFVTHAGMNSTNEAAWFGVPVIACPFFGDGIVNARRFAELGAGINIDYRIATPFEVMTGRRPFSTDAVPPVAMRSAFHAVLDDPSYRHAALALRTVFRTEADFDAAIAEMLEWVASRNAHVHQS
ncbi:MAG TPA: nucleotide disphospho-sugar-binding domain-containing protein [Thermoanaerobaculia bacterium]|nr:nucleotide disphospho-sugar-binding domain-containing protein [Thermoanaerobaculia bacterium]